MKKNTTLICHFGTFQFEVIHFSLMNAPSTFHRLIDELIKDLLFTRSYLDAIVVLLATMSEHEEHVWQGVQLFYSHGLKIKLKKCKFGLCRVSLLGHIVDGSSLIIDPGMVSAISGAAVSKNHT